MSSGAGAKTEDGHKMHLSWDEVSGNPGIGMGSGDNEEWLFIAASGVSILHIPRQQPVCSHYMGLVHQAQQQREGPILWSDHI